MEILLAPSLGLATGVGDWGSKQQLVGEAAYISSCQHKEKKIERKSMLCAVLQINMIPLLVTMNRKIKKPPVKLNFWWSQ